MKISVVIPVLDEERLLPALLDRLAGMPLQEILVVDGGSRDRTLEIIADFGLSIADCPQSPIPNRKSQIRLLAAPGGRASQMNAGAAAAQGDVLLFLHADTTLPEDAPRAIHEAMHDSRYVGGRFDVRFEPDAGLRWLISRLMSLRSRLTGICTGDQAIFVRRSVFERLGGFPVVPLMEDVAFSRRLKAAGRIAALRATVTTSYRRWETGGPLRTVLLMWTLRLLYWLGVSPQKLSHFYGEVR
jgi:rSAM/selenodomain-associated transferase 2